jgi:hypothetical protein
MRDDAEAPPSILDECSRLSGRGATFSLNELPEESRGAELSVVVPVPNP